MSHGMNVYWENGNLCYSTDDVTWNQVDFVFIPGGTSFSQSYPVLSGREVLLNQMFINTPSFTGSCVANSLSVSDTTVSAVGGNQDTYLLVLMR